MIIPDVIQVSGSSIRLDLFYGFGARDRTGNGRVLQAPCQRPLGHANASGNFFLPDSFQLPELLLYFFPFDGVSDIVWAREFCAGLVLPVRSPLARGTRASVSSRLK